MNHENFSALLDELRRDTKPSTIYCGLDESKISCLDDAEEDE